MTTSNPLLQAKGLPDFSAILPEHVVPAIETVIDGYTAEVNRLTAQRDHDWDSLMLAIERQDDRLAGAWSPVSHLHGVMDSEALREVYNTALEKITEFETDLGQNRALYEAMLAVRERPDFARLDPARRKLVDDSLRDFRISGVHLEGEAKARYKQIASELSRLGTEFEEHLLDATDAWSEHFSDPAALAGLPAQALALAHQYAQQRGLDGWLVNLQMPSYQAVMTYAEDRRLRERLYTAYNTRASDQGPQAGKFDNGPVIGRLLALRHEAARLLGFESPAALSLATKMAPSPDAVRAFLEDLAQRARPVAQRELAELGELMREEFGVTDLKPWDVGFASERLKRRKLDLDSEALKPYFAVSAVLGGMFSISERLFGIRFAQRDDVKVWHPDVRYYDVFDRGGELIAGVYTDWYARSGKRGGAWMDVCRSRFRDGAALDLPVAYLTCNFPPPVGDAPSLLTHDEVCTLFHEFGHGLHLMLTEVDFPSLGGTNVEWDAVELPSQFMENFCWERESLDLFARHHETGEPMPGELFERLMQSKYFLAGMFLVRQLEFALFDLRLHEAAFPESGKDVLDVLSEVRAAVSVVRPPEWNRFPHGFSHIFAGGYAAGYYSYLWAERLSADAFGRFEERGVLDAESGQAFRSEVLARGGVRPAMESFVAFRGREPDSTALLRSYGLAA